jgi:serine/threonine protein kinase
MFSRDKPIPEPGDARDNAHSASSGSANDGETPMLHTSIGSGLLAQQPTPEAEEHVSVIKVCPQCGGEYETGDRFCPRDGAPLRPKGGSDALIGRVIADRYLILAKLGEGGMGRVYVAEHVKMNRQCAIKVMNPSLMNDPESARRFAREASNAARILHPNVAAVFDYGEADRIVYLVMEYVDGDSLSTILERDRVLDPRRAIDIARQVADGLSSAHELGLIHRDLKPDNIIVASRRNGRETAKVVDFGIAKAVSDAPQDSLTRSGLVIGTPEYMSPEQLLGDPVDARTDIYALGCILFQMLTGVRPFEAESRELMLRRRLHEPPPHVRDLRPELPRRLDTLIAYMLARAPGDRMASAAEVCAQLDPALALSGWDPSSLRASVKSTRATPQVTPLTSDPAMRPTVRMKRHRASVTRVVVGTILGSGTVFASLLLWSLWSHDLSVQNQRQAAAVPELPPITVASPTVAPLTKHPADSFASKPKTAPIHTPPAAAANKPAATADSTPPPAPVATDVAIEEAAVHEPLEKFATAVGHGDVAIRDAFPDISPTILGKLKDFLVMVDNVTAKPIYGTTTINGDKAELKYNLNFSFTYRDSKAPGTAQFKYHATLTRRRDGWAIADLTTIIP